MKHSKEEIKIIKRVETFIQRIHDLDYVIKPEARNIIYKGFVGSEMRIRSLSDFLSGAIAHFETAKTLKNAISCLYWIDKAFSCGVVQEGEGLISKNEKLKKELKLLRDQLRECRQRCQALEIENKQLHKLFGGTSFTGDVQ